jgi:HNH endonuclease
MDRELEQFVWERAKHRCEYCRFPAVIALLPFQIDHIISQKLHGPTSAENLALCCERCNSHKGPLAAGYLEGKHVPLFNPRTDQWRDHFAWNGGHLVGKTDVGKVTIDVLAINLPYRVALRAALMEEGAYPVEEY